MCSRYSYTKNEVEFRRRERIEVYGAVPRYNIAPTKHAVIPIIIEADTGPRLLPMAWGWKADWTPALLINAKSESLTTKRSFRKDLHRRCLVPMDGFYENLATPAPVRFVRPGNATFFAAALWHVEADTGPDPRFVMLTTAPNESVSRYHHRMPFIVPPDKHKAWLTADDQLETLLTAPDQTEFEAYHVAKAVSNSRNEGPHLIQPVTPEKPPEQPGLF